MRDYAHIKVILESPPRTPRRKDYDDDAQDFCRFTTTQRLHERRAGKPAGSESRGSELTSAAIPGHGTFFLTDAALEMIAVFGGTLHCYLGPGGCRKQGLYFSRTVPRKPLRCALPGADGARLEVSVSHDLAPKLDGAVLDFGAYNKMQRFVWASLPAVKGPQCTCLRFFFKQKTAYEITR